MAFRMIREQEIAPKKAGASSVVRLLNAAYRQLEHLLYNLDNETDVSSKILDVAKTIHTSITLNTDIAFACILLNQKSGDYAVRHCIDTAIIALSIARAMKKTTAEMKAIVAAALTMNIGMLEQHDALQARQEPLTPVETDYIKAHPETSVARLKQAGVDNQDWLAFVALHHESSKGTGYPLGQQVGEIPQNAKILALADRYCASIIQRKYRKTLLPQAALRDVLLTDGKPEDATLAAYFVKEVGNFPPGTFVRLQTGEIGVVIRKGASPATPVVQAIINSRDIALPAPVSRDTAKPLFGIREALLNDGKMLRFSLQQLWGSEAAL